MLAVLPQMTALQSYRSVYGFVSPHIRDEALLRAFSFQPLLMGGNPFHTTSIYTIQITGAGQSSSGPATASLPLNITID